MEYNDEFQQEETIDIKKYLFKILDNWYWFAFSIFIALAVAYILNRYSEPVYTVNSSVIVRDDENTRGLSGSDNLVMKNFDIFQSKKNVQNEIGILQS
ncbi:MAG: Wzz/FepE/Etk N-terminal domain-containing protein, partial [Bacteroidota bacterium]|nr:Wzz/FepE/Etk N-terminal domain-containing protein [Bacteroidota bacterium]